MAPVFKGSSKRDLFPSSTSSEAEIFHKLINVVKPNVQKNPPSVQKKSSVNGNEKITVGESITIR